MEKRAKELLIKQDRRWEKERQRQIKEHEGETWELERIKEIKGKIKKAFSMLEEYCKLPRNKKERKEWMHGKISHDESYRNLLELLNKIRMEILSLPIGDFFVRSAFDRDEISRLLFLLDEIAKCLNDELEIRWLESPHS